MIETKVVDASALAALLLREPEAEAVASRLQDASLVAPSLLRYELTNICLTKIKRHPEGRETIIQRLDRMLRLGIKEMQVDHHEILSLALKTGLTAYDASYLWLALHLDAELVTLDRRLATAWAQTKSS